MSADDRAEIHARLLSPGEYGIRVDVEFDHSSASVSVGLGPWTFWVGWSA